MNLSIFGILVLTLRQILGNLGITTPFPKCGEGPYGFIQLKLLDFHFQREIEEINLNRCVYIEHKHIYT